VFGVLAFDAAMPARGARRDTGAGCLATRAGTCVCWSFYFCLSRHSGIRFALLAVPGRQCLISPGHIGLARPVARQPIDINDAG